MDPRSEIRDFLVSRRARLRPQDAGLPDFGGVRRVPGLRREEVAHLAGVSVDYYNRLERGKTSGTSRQVLDAIATALQLDPVEREHLHDLFAATRSGSSRRVPRVAARSVRPSVQAVLDGMPMPAFVQNHRMDIVAANPLGRALYAGSEPTHKLLLPHNLSRYVFLDPGSPAFYDDWARVARNHVALLRQAGGRHPDDPALLHLIGELSNQSPEFRDLWATHDVLKFREGRKVYHHPFVGRLEFSGEVFDLARDEDLSLLAYTFEPASPTAQAVTLLASWIAGAPSPAEKRAPVGPAADGSPGPETR